MWIQYLVQGSATKEFGTLLPKEAVSKVYWVHPTLTLPGRGWTFVTDEQDGLRDESSDGDDEEEEEEEKDGYRLDKLFGGVGYVRQIIVFK